MSPSVRVSTLAALLAWSALSTQSACILAVPPEAAATIGRPVRESSGLVASRTRSGVMWTHGDSGNETEIYAVTPEGEWLQTVEIEGADNVDWEDIATDDTGRLYIADTGNNDNDRDDLVVYVVPEPATGAESVSVEHTLYFRYPDQEALPDPKARNFDAEALFWAQDRLYLLTKHRSNQQTVLYRFPDLSGAQEVVLERLGAFDLGGNPNRYGGRATAADATPDGQRLAVLAYHALFVFERPSDSESFLDGDVHEVALKQTVLRQCESVTWDLDGDPGSTLWIGNEQGHLFRVDDPLTLDRFP